MMMNRREYKRKPSDEALEEESEIIEDVDSWESSWPTFLEKINSPRPELQLSALKSINKVLTTRYLGYKNLEPFLDDTLKSIHERIIHRATREEHDEALAVLCNLSLNCFNEMEPFAHLFLDEIIPLLPEITEDESFRFFTIAFLVAISSSNKEMCMKTFRVFLNLILHRKERGTEFTTEMIAELIKGLCLLVSSFPDEFVTVELIDELQSVLDLAIQNKKAPIILAAIELIPIIFEAIIGYETDAELEAEVEGVKDEFSATALSKQFVSSYRNKIAELGNDLPKKADQRAVRERLDEINEILDGKEVEDQVMLNSQNIIIRGVRNNVILQAIKRVTKRYFLQTMQQNPLIRQFFDFDLLTSHHALRLKKKFKKEIRKDRIESKKEREMEIDRKRDVKDGLIK